jgi:ABC-type Fe3+ transport system substrate-binding protein
MKRLLLVLAVFPLLVSAEITGEWRGKVQAISPVTHQPQTVAVYATLSQAKGLITGTASTSGAAKEIKNVVVSGSLITFSVVEATGTATFTITDSGAALGKKELSGTVTLPTGQILPVTFTSVR